MMDKTKSRLARGVEIATNLSIILVALVGATVLVRNYLLHPGEPPASEASQATLGNSQAGPGGLRVSSGNPAPKKAPAEGTQLSVPGVNWRESDKTVLLALSKGCHFCSESAPFYQHLTRELSERKDVRLIAVFPQEIDEAKKYLDGLGVPIGDVRQASLGSLGVAGTPTLIIVDKSGTVKQAWIGRLTPEREQEVLSRVRA
jgi:thiol-disulfide isomerase/thioredoxin